MSSSSLNVKKTVNFTNELTMWGWISCFTCHSEWLMHKTFYISGERYVILNVYVSLQLRSRWHTLPFSDFICKILRFRIFCNSHKFLYELRENKFIEAWWGNKLNCGFDLSAFKCKIIWFQSLHTLSNVNVISNHMPTIYLALKTLIIKDDKKISPTSWQDYCVLCMQISMWK